MRMPPNPAFNRTRRRRGFILLARASGGVGRLTGYVRPQIAMRAILKGQRSIGLLRDAF